MILVTAGIALLWALLQFGIISRVKIQSAPSADSEAGAQEDPLLSDDNTTTRLIEIYSAIYEGAESFLRAEYRVCFIFVAGFTVIIFILVGWGAGWDMARGGFSALSFLLGALTSMASGYLGMKVAVYSNVRTTVSAQKPGYKDCFNIAFRAGSVMGFSLCGLGILVLYVTMLAFSLYFDQENWLYLTECLTGFGLGGSVIAMFGRVGGGTFRSDRVCWSTDVK